MTAKDWAARLIRPWGGGVGVPAPAPRRYIMRERLGSVRDDVAITDREGEPVFSVDGRALQLRDTLVLRDRYDAALYRIPSHALHMKDAMEVERADGAMAATIRRARTPGGHDRWTVTIPGRGRIRLLGSAPDHEYRLEAGGARVAEASRRWSRQDHTYGVEVEPGEDNALILMIAVAVDLMVR